MFNSLKLVAATLAVFVGVLSTTYASAADSLGVSTIAGTGTSGAGGDNADATQSALYYPYGATTDSVGNVYIADTYNHRIQKIDTTGAVTTIAGTGTSGAGGDNADATLSALYYPYDLDVDAAGNVYIADTYNHRIQRVDTTGAVTTIAGTGAYGAGGDNADATQSAIYNPYGVAVDASGNVYIADTDNHRIQRVDTTGAVTTIAGTGAEGAGGDNADATQSALDTPRDVSLDTADNVYIADASNHRIQKVDATSAVTTFAGTGTAGTGADNADATQSALNYPNGVAADTEGNVYIADTYNHRVQKIDTNGAVASVAGTGTLGTGADNADATQSALHYPYGVAVNAAGDLYIADSANHRIQKVVADNTEPAIDNTDPANDDIDPTINIINPGTTVLGSTITLNYICADTDGSGIDTCTATLNGEAASTGDTITVATRGTQTLTVTAVDNAANTAIETATFTANGQRELNGDYKNASGPRGAIARLYMAAFARNPEAAGFAYWETRYNSGTTLLQVAEFFSSSPEFIARYGTTTNADFVELMYTNVMVRTAETEGYTYWLAQLGAGMTRAQMLLLFSESPEFKQITYSS